MRELALFAGAGGGILGGHILGWRTVCAVEWDTYAASVLIARQNDGVLPPFPIWDDVRTFDGRPWRGCVDVVSGGFPCQDISSAGKGAGITGERSGLWTEMARIVGEVRPRFVFVENSPNLVSRGLAVVLGDIAALGYDARWCVLGADDVGAPHRRKRIWIVAESNSDGRHADHRRGVVPDGIGDTSSNRGLAAQVMWPTPTVSCATGGQASRSGSRKGELLLGGAVRTFPTPKSRDGKGQSQRGIHAQGDALPNMDDGTGHVVGGSLSPDWVEWLMGWPPGWTSLAPLDRAVYDEWEKAGAEWWDTEHDLPRVAVGVPARAHRLRCIGNGQVPACAAMAWEILTAAGEGGEGEKP